MALEMARWENMRRESQGDRHAGVIDSRKVYLEVGDCRGVGGGQREGVGWPCGPLSAMTGTLDAFLTGWEATQGHGQECD